MACRRDRAMILRFFAVLAILLLALAACSGGGGDDDDDSSDGGGQVAEDAGVNEASGGAEAPADGGQEGAETESDGGDVARSDTDTSGGEIRPIIYQSDPDNRLVIRTAQLTITVNDVGQATAWVRDVANQTGGYVFGASTYMQEDDQYSQITIKVPADQFDNVVNQINTAPFVVTVDREETSSQDVSAEFVDNEARLGALEQTQERYLALLADADNIDAIIRIETELTDIRSQIEQIKGRQKYLQEMTAFSTISVTFQPENGEPIDDEEDEDTFIARVFGDSWDRASGVIEGLLATTVTLGIVLIAVAPFAVIVYLLYRLYRRRQEEPIQPVAQQPSADA